MSTITCPVCNKDHDDGDYPDMLIELGPSQRAPFECDCGADFEVHVDFEAIYYPLNETVKMRKSE